MKKIIAIAVLFAIVSSFAPQVYATSFGNAVVLSFSNNELFAYDNTRCITNTTGVYYKFTAPTAGPYSIYLSGNQAGASPYSALPDDYDMKLFNNSQTLLATSAKSSTTPEQIHFTVSAANTTYYILVYPWSAYDPNTKYKLTVFAGDAAMFTEGSRYRDYNEYPVFIRDGAGIVTGGVTSQGVAYSYGGKNSLSYYATQNSTAYANASKPLNAWACYNSSFKRPGLYMAEYPNSNFYGIDCTGLIQRMGEAATATGSSTKRYKLSSDKPLSDTGVNAVIVDSNYYTSMTQAVFTANMQTGYVITFTGHAYAISRVNTSNWESSKSISAEADSFSQGGHIVKEFTISKYSAKTKSYWKLILL